MARKPQSIRQDVATFHLVRAADSPPTLHSAADRYEQANLVAVNAWAPGALDAALVALDLAKTAFGRECLALDKHRRPTVYAVSAA